MRHRKRGRKFGRVRKVRRAFLRSLVRALTVREKIRTTEARAKELRPKIEKLITRLRRGTLAARREAAEILDQKAAKKLMEIAARYRERPGGYIRITKLSRRGSDAAKMAIIEFVK